MADKIIIIGEIKEGMIRNVTFEAIGAAKQINESSEIIGILCGQSDLNIFAEEMIQYGADRVITVTHDALATYTSEGYSQAILSIINAEKPECIIMGHTAIGRDLTPKLAARLEIGLISDVVGLEFDSNHQRFIKPIYAGKAFERKVSMGATSFITIRPNNITAPIRDEARVGTIEVKEMDITAIRTIIKEVIKQEKTGIDLSEAKIIIAGGRGIGSEAEFNLLYELADVLGGAVGASRGACDAGYCDYALQIGQTGKTVTPDLYIAVGISGAIQHVAGMSNAKAIVAINNDPDAEIFQIADYGIVGDLKDVLPSLIAEFKQMQIS